MTDYGRVLYIVYNGKFHRCYDLPAYIFDDGSKFWYQHGKLHRDTIGPDGDDLPAVIFTCGTKEWYQHGNFIK